jgi:hypothetical protein
VETDYYILRASRIIPGKFIKLYKLDESSDSMLRDKAIETLKNRGLTIREASDYLESLEYVPTRGG